MNLHAIANPIIAAINPNVVGSVLTSTGATTNDAGHQTPTYCTHPYVTIQVQALTAGELAHLDGLNIQGILRGFWLMGDVAGVVRVREKGGDLIKFPTTGVPKTLCGTTWLVAHIFETWDTPGWCHVAGVLQI